MHSLSGIVVVAGAVLLIGVAVLVFGKPALAERFFRGFASSAGTPFSEQIFRVVFGGALVIYSSAMWQTAVFRLIGWLLVVSSVLLMLLPWQWHHRFGQKIMPRFIQHMWLYGVGALAFGAAILYAVFSPHLNGTV